MSDTEIAKLLKKYRLTQLYLAVMVTIMFLIQALTILSGGIK